jgi:predicted DNA-binding ribbon-helix-helix protein
MIDLPPLSPPVKRSVTIDGHRTSVSLEEAFWRALGRIAKARGETRAALIAAIDHARPPEVGLATALRLFVLDQMQHLGDAAPRAEGPR